MFYLTEDAIRVWESEGFKVELWETGKRHGTGQHRLQYRFSDHDKMVFVGDDYGCSPLHCIDSDDTVFGLLGFLSLGKGDTDPEYFESYDKAQLAWRDSPRREELSLLVYDFEEGYTA